MSGGCPKVGNISDQKWGVSVIAVIWELLEVGSSSMVKTSRWRRVVTRTTGSTSARNAPGRARRSVEFSVGGLEQGAYGPASPYGVCGWCWRCWRRGVLARTVGRRMRLLNL